jgi:butyryl-CoA dehydrogenase
MQLPMLVANFMQGIFQAANGSAVGYIFLTTSNAHMLEACGSDELRARYLPPLVEGRWFGTMCLSEPHAGSSLSDIRCMAEPLGDGSFKLTGTKMWISGGDQDVSENICTHGACSNARCTGGRKRHFVIFSAEISSD